MPARSSNADIFDLDDLETVGHRADKYREVLELYRKRAFCEVDDESKVVWRAFGKATWRKPRGVAADADLMQIE
jgi:hypothetical protein